VKRWLLALVPLPFALAFSAWASARVAERAGASAAVALSAVSVLLRGPLHLEPPEDVVIPTEELALPEPIAAPPVKGKKRGGKAIPSGPSVVFVGRDKVLNIANAGARPRGVPVAATPLRPAGLQLFGVGALGIGLRDGDVLTRALGQPALSSGAVIGAVLKARAQRVAVLEGEFFRGAQRWLIRVEQPYLPERVSEGPEPEGPRLTMRETRPRLATP
jgi:hypothetical protein